MIAADGKVDLCEMLASGRFKPGDRLMETKIADELGVSRVPVREALTRLVAQGILVASGNWRGVWVREYSPNEIQDLYQLREALESKAAALTAVRASANERVKLVEIVDRLESLMDNDNYGSDEWSQWDQRLHIGIIDSSGNERFRLLFDSLLHESRFIFYHHPLRRRDIREGSRQLLSHSADVRRQHRAMVEAMAAGEADIAAVRTAEHLRSAAEQAVYSLTRKSG